MKYFLDTEFIEGFRKPLFGKKRWGIDLISIGIYREDGKSLYLISSEYDYKKASDWVKTNVIIPMYIDTVRGDQRNEWDADDFHKGYGKTKNAIAGAVLDFFGCGYDEGAWYAPEGIEVYGYYADYDWVLLCSLFGTMMDLPKGFPMYCRDLKQSLDEIESYRMRFSTRLKFGIMDTAKHHHTPKEILDKIKAHGEYPKQENEHNALADAKWNYKLYQFIQTF